MDELSQYFFLYQKQVWEGLLSVGFPELDFLEANGKINSVLGDNRSKKSASKIGLSVVYFTDAGFVAEPRIFR